MLLNLKNSLTSSHSAAKANALVQAVHSLTDHLLQDIFGHPMFEPVAVPDSLVNLATANQLKSNLLQISLLKRKIRACAESISLDSTPEQIHSASTSIAEAIAELSGVALRRIESQQQEWQQKIDSLTPFATIASPPAPEVKQTVQAPPTPGPAASPAPPPETAARLSEPAPLPAASSAPQPTAHKPVAPQPETAARLSEPAPLPAASSAPQPTAHKPVAPQPESKPSAPKLSAPKLSAPKLSPEPAPLPAAQAPTPAPNSPAESAPAPTTAEIQPRSLFEFALNEARQASGCFLAVLPIERFSIYQSRFGTHVAKDIFDYFSQYLRRRLRPTDQIFYWADGVVLAIVPRTVSIDSVRAEFMRLGLQKVEQTVSLGGGRSFHLSMSSNFAVLGVEKGATNDQLIKKIDNLLLVSAKSS